MERLEFLLSQVEEVTFNGKRTCIETLDNRLQDILYYLEANKSNASGEWIELKGCSWVLHERYHMDNEEQMMWTFHHTRHKIIRSCKGLLETDHLRKKLALVKEQKTHSNPESQTSDETPYQVLESKAMIETHEV